MIKTDKEIKTLKTHIDETFKHLPNTLYRLWVVYDQYNESINFFMLIQAKRNRPHSIPLHMVPTLDLAVLEEIVNALKEYQLPFVFVNFAERKWPQSQRRIQPPRVKQ